MAGIDTEIEQLEAQLKAKKAARLQEKTAAKTAVAADVREHLNEYLQTYLEETYPDNPEYHSLTLQDIFTAAKDARPYHFVNPADATQTYSGRGMPPKWYQVLGPSERKTCKHYLETKPAEEPAQPTIRRQAEERRRVRANAQH